jgi:hypothetical protein
LRIFKGAALGSVGWSATTLGTRVKTLIPGEKYRVTVGIGNPEDGVHD